MTSPVFVAGPSRSGTALVRSLLNGHPEIHIANETHFFDDLRRRVPIEGRLGPDEQAVVVDYFRALTHRPYGHFGDPERGWLDAAALSARAAALGGRADDFLRAYCEVSAIHDDGRVARIWGEKTPRHIFRVDEILEAFPDARVVAMVRDPRAVVASYKKWRNQGGLPGADDPAHEAKLAAEAERTRRSYHPVLLSLLWRGQANAAAAALDRHGTERVWLQRYEDLVVRPEATGRGMTEWLGLEFVPEMLDVPMHNSSFSTFDEGKGVTAEAVERWRDVLDPSEVAAVQRTCAALMASNGYEPISTSASVPARLRPYATFPYASLEALRANGDRSGGLPSFVARRVRALLSG